MVVIALVLSAAMTFGSYFQSHTIAPALHPGRAGRPQRVLAPHQPGAGSLAGRRHHPAQGLRGARRVAQRLRHGAQPGDGGRGGHDRAARQAQPGRARRGRGPRDRPHPQQRHPGDDRGGRHRRLDRHHLRPVLADALFRDARRRRGLPAPQQQRSGRRRQRDRPRRVRHRVGDRSARRCPPAGRHQPQAGVARRRHSRRVHPLPHRPAPGPREARRRHHRGEAHLPRHLPPVDRVARRSRDQRPGPSFQRSVQHSSPATGAHRPAASDGGAPPVPGPRSGRGRVAAHLPVGAVGPRRYGYGGRGAGRCRTRRPGGVGRVHLRRRRRVRRHGRGAADDDDPTHARAGWYADPGGEPDLLRYWNGTEWTDHRHEIPDQNRTEPPGARARRARSNRRSGWRMHQR